MGGTSSVTVTSSSCSFLWLLALILCSTLQTCLTLLGATRPIFYLLPISCMAAFVVIYRVRRLLPSRDVYVVDFSCLKPPPRLRVPFSGLLEHLSLIGCFDGDSVAFMSKVVASSGLGEETCLPPSLHYIPPKTQLVECTREAQLLLFLALDDLFAKTPGVSPADVDILVVNCSGFCSAPSLSSMVVNRYRMREDVRSFNVSGMGCSAGVIGVDIVRGLFAVHPDSYAVVVSTEVLSTGWYSGQDRSKLLLNCVFRMGSAAVLLTNRRDVGKSASKYRLVRLLREQRTFDDAAYCSATRVEDEQGITGFSIDKDRVATAVRETVRSNIMALGASILPLKEKLRYAHFCLHRAIMAVSKGKKPAAYVPDFSSVIQHYCIPASGKALIREIGKGAGLRERDMEPAMATLHRFGNQSSSSIWYQVAYLEAKGRVRKGDRVWQLGVGSGTKCNSAVWECLREDIAADGEAVGKGPWRDCVDRYPVVDDEQNQKQVAGIDA